MCSRFSPYHLQMRSAYQIGSGRRVTAVDPDIQIEESVNQTETQQMNLAAQRGCPIGPGSKTASAALLDLEVTEGIKTSMLTSAPHLIKMISCASFVI